MTVTGDPVVPMTPDEEAFIRALGRVIQVLPRSIDADMASARQLPLSEYTALMHLSEAPGRLMRMSELAASCDLSLSGMTRIVERLERQDLVKRVKCEEDRRGSNAMLTEAGLARLEESWPAHLASVRRQVLDHVQGEDLARLTDVLKRIAAAT
ncbi:MarR family winged helix-turn-helix transcriptional regulator [Actinoallomurus liliacearum]|uniref:MarR family winged helix-turn-helix transcriptional regulator n=1 Tax=Actinoallomurus liliacearum TaxID=1080073 RepID=A0ABP8U038_9ACTN